jgi:hypothetical protein
MITHKNPVPENVSIRAREIKSELEHYCATMSDVSGKVEVKHIVNYFCMNIAELQIKVENCKCQEP